MTPEQSDKARADLREKVALLMKEASEYALEKLTTLELSGSGVLQDHINNSREAATYKTPAEFISAFCEELKVTYGPRHPNQAAKVRIKNYTILM